MLRCSIGLTQEREQFPKQLWRGCSMLTAWYCIHQKDAENHVANHSCETRISTGADHAPNNNQRAQLHLGDATLRWLKPFQGNPLSLEWELNLFSLRQEPTPHETEANTQLLLYGNVLRQEANTCVLLRCKWWNIPFHHQTELGIHVQKTPRRQGYPH